MVTTGRSNGISVREAICPFPYPFQEIHSMRVLLRTGPLLLALGVALTGCSQSSAPERKAAADKPEKVVAAAHTASAPTESTTAKGSEYVLTVEGMV
jgi:hypothetical protein